MKLRRIQMELPTI